MGGVWESIKGAFKDMGKGFYNAIIPDNMVATTLESIGGVFKRSNPPEYLTYEVTRYSISALREYKKSVAKLPSNYGNYKKNVGKFSDVLIDKFKEYGLVLVKFLSTTELEFNKGKLKEECAKYLKEIKKKCEDSEITKLTSENYAKFVKDNNVNTTTVEKMLIGDLATQLKTCAENTIALLKGKKEDITEFNDEIFVEGGKKLKYNDHNEKERIIKDLSDACKTNFFALVANKFKSVKDRLSTNTDDVIRSVGKAMTAGEIRLEPVEYYTFGKYLSRRSAASIGHILEIYSKTLKSYPDELSGYKTSGIRYINHIVVILKKYVHLLKSLSKSGISVNEKLKIRQNAKDLLKSLQIELDEALKDESVKKVTTAGGSTQQSIKGGGEHFGICKGYDPHNAKILIDGWVLTDFLTPMKRVVDKTLKDIDSLIKTDGTVDYKVLEVSDPQEKKFENSKQSEYTGTYKTRDQQAKEKVKLEKQEASSKKQKLAEIDKQRKNLVKVLEEAISIFRAAFKQRLEVDKAVNSANFMSPNYQKSYLKLENEILKKYSDLDTAYLKICKPNYRIPGEVRSIKIALIENGEISEGAFNTFDPSKSKLLSPDVALQELYNITAQCLDSLSDMRNLFKQIDEKNKYLIRTYGTASKETIKNREKLTDLLEQIIRTTNSVFVKLKDTFNGFDDVLNALSDTRIAEFNDSKKKMEELQRRLIKEQYAPVCTYEPNGVGKEPKYTLIGGKQEIVIGTINSLSLSELTDRISFCSKRLLDIKNISDDMDDLEKQLIKDFNKDLKEVEKARAKVAKMLTEAKTLQKSAQEISGKGQVYGMGYYKPADYPELTGLYEKFGTHFAQVQVVLGKINGYDVAIFDTPDDIKILKLDVLQKFIKEGPAILKEFKEINKTLNEDLKKMQKEAETTGGVYKDKAYTLQNILEKIIESKNVALEKADTTISRFKNILNALSDHRKNALKKYVNELKDYKNTITLNYAVVCDIEFKVSAGVEKRYNFINENDEINTQAIETLNMEHMDQAIDRCSEQLDTIKKVSKNMDAHMKKITKDFDKDLKEVEKARREAAKILNEANDLSDIIDGIRKNEHSIFESVDKAKRTSEFEKANLSCLSYSLNAKKLYDQLIIALDPKMWQYNDPDSGRETVPEDIPQGNNIPSYMSGLELGKLQIFIKQGNKTLPELRKCEKNIKSASDKFQKEFIKSEGKLGEKAFELKNILEQIVIIWNETNKLKREFGGQISATPLEVPYGNMETAFNKVCEFGYLVQSKLPNLEFSVNFDSVLKHISSNETVGSDLTQRIKVCRDTLKTMKSEQKEFNKCFSEIRQKISKKTSQKIKELKDHLKKITEIWSDTCESIYERIKDRQEIQNILFVGEFQKLLKKILDIKYFGFNESKSVVFIKDDTDNTISKMSLEVLTEEVNMVATKHEEIKKFKDKIDGDIEKNNKKNELREKAKNIIDMFEDAAKKVAECVQMDQETADFVVPEPLNKEFAEMLKIVMDNDLYFITSGSIVAGSYEEKLNKAFPKYLPYVINDNLINNLDFEKLSQAVENCKKKLEELKSARKVFDKKLLEAQKSKKNSARTV